MDRKLSDKPKAIDGERRVSGTTGHKSVFVKTFGCQMNVYDSDRMMEALAQDGYATTDSPDNADLVILNTCHIREKAAEKVYSDLGRLKQIKDRRAADGQQTVIAVAGCVAQAEGGEITARQPAVDMVIGPQSYHRMPELLARVEQTRERVIETEFDGDGKFAKLTAPRRTASPSAFLTIQEGCDKFCTFCVVPYTRGFEVSRPVTEIVREARELVAAGAREITLLGQNVNAYHGEDECGRDTSLADLIRRLGDIDGLKRIRYTTSHPRDMTDDLIRAHRDVSQLMPFLHLPVQSGSDAMLAAMNRRHTASDYYEVIGRLRDACPDIALSSDFIVGFPGETEEDAAATLKLISEVGFAQAFSFKYSARPGTPAAGREDQVAGDVKARRLAEVQALLDRQQSEFNATLRGQTVPVLVERRGREPGALTGRTPYLQLVHFDGAPELIGEMIKVEITDTRQASLSGTRVAA